MQNRGGRKGCAKAARIFALVFCISLRSLRCISSRTLRLNGLKN
jgi:hypothetical protein